MLMTSGAMAGEAYVDHEFRGSEETVSLKGGAGQFNGVRHTFADQAEPNRYFLYYRAEEPYELSLTDGAAVGTPSGPALVVKREVGGDVEFGGLALVVPMAGWSGGNVTTADLDNLLLNVTLAAPAGQPTPVTLEVNDDKGQFVERINLPLEIANDGEFHDHTYSLMMLPESEKNRIVNALNKVASTKLTLNFGLSFKNAGTEAPYLAIRKLKLEGQ